jgi:hypothetical protein
MKKVFRLLLVLTLVITCIACNKKVEPFDLKDEYYEDIDEMLSAIDNGDDISNFDIPEKIKKESKVTERLLNFYITLL